MRYRRASTACKEDARVSARAPWRRRTLMLACCAAVLTAVAVVLALGSGKGADSDLPAPDAAREAMGDLDPAVADDARDVLSKLEEQGGAPVDEHGDESFLARLDGSDAGSEGSALVAWSCSGDIVSLGEKVLLQYERLEGAGLVAGGYLDLHGRTWGAVISLGDGRVDVAVLSASEGGHASTARIVRLDPEGLGGR